MGKVLVMPNTYKKTDKELDYYFYLEPSKEKKGTFKPKPVEDL